MPWPNVYVSPRRDGTGLGDEAKATAIDAVRHSSSLRVMAVMSELADAGMPWALGWWRSRLLNNLLAHIF